mgnify:CR=1 FL=1
MKVKLISTAITLALALSACDSSVQNDTVEAPVKPAINTQVNNKSKQVSEKEQLDGMYKEATKILFKQRAFSASTYGLSPEEVGAYYADKVEDFTPKSEGELRDELRALSQEIKNYPLTSTAQIDKDNQQVMTSIVRYYAGNSNFNIGYIDTWMGLSPFIVNQINGPLISIPRNLQNDHQINNEKDAQDYIARLAQFEQLIGSIEDKFLADAKQNWIPPKITLNGALRYLTGFISAEPKSHSLVLTFSDKVNKLDNISTDKKQLLISQAIEKVTAIVYPAYQSITKATEKMLVNGREESGIWAQPNGEAYYQDAIKMLGDSALTASEIHQLGLSEVKRIGDEMHAILVKEGYNEGSVGNRMIALNDEKRFLYDDSDEGRAQAISDINGYIKDITTKMSPVFKTTPTYEVEVRAYPVEIQDGSPGGEYTSPSVDGSKPGVYWINLRDMKANPKFALKTLTYHEANPGHHWQIALNMDQAQLPFLRRIAPYNAYAEGWALYSEQVAQELGMYEDDPFGNLGRLQAEMYRAVRLVVDTGMHDKHWTREQAITYMVEQTGSAESDVVAEIERYMAWPGQALGYKLGMLKILSLREHAQETLADKFDLSAFHDVVLLGGAVPMSVLEHNINQWIAGQQ